MRTNSGQFAKGYSGNPGGRPKGPSLSAILADVLNENDPENPDRTNAETIIRLMVSNAKRGDFKFILAIVDRIEGKPGITADDDDMDTLDGARKLLIGANPANSTPPGLGRRDQRGLRLKLE